MSPTDVRALPGVLSAGADSDLPRTGYDKNLGFDIVCRPTREDPSARFHVASPGYFETPGIRLEAGRLFTHGDTPDTPKVLIVNAALAARYSPGESAGAIVEPGLQFPACCRTADPQRQCVGWSHCWGRNFSSGRQRDQRNRD